jgi:hypothetical protein
MCSDHFGPNGYNRRTREEVLHASESVSLIKNCGTGMIVGYNDSDSKVPFGQACDNKRKP